MAATEISAARFAGARIARVEDPRLLRGRGTYVADITRVGMLHACFVRSPYARAVVRRIDVAAAVASPGVRAVFTADDLNPMVHEQWYTSIGKDVPDTPRPPLAAGVVRHVGDPVVIVIAGDRYLAEDAAELIEVDYDPLPPVADYQTARDTTELVHDGYASNVAGSLGRPPSDRLSAIFDSAAYAVAVSIHQHAHAPVPMETRGLVVDWSGEELSVWASTQSPHEVRLFLARLLGIGEHQVRVVARDTGGGFGQKVMPMREEMSVALAAFRLALPVSWIEDRRENLMSAGMSRHEHGDCRLAFDADGTLLAAYIDHVQDIGAYPTPWPVGTSAAVGMLFPGGYRCPAAGFRTTSVFSNTAGRVAYRGPWQFETLGREVALDIAARRMSLDPIDLRRRNLLRQDELPLSSPTGMPYSAMTPLECFERAIELFDVTAFRRQQSEALAAGRYIGVGTSSYVEPTTTGMAFYGTEGATIRIEPTGRVNVYLAGGSSGNSLETTAIQLAADALGVDITDVHTVQGDTAVTPFGAGTGGSRSASMVAGAITRAAAPLHRRMCEIAAARLEAAVEDIVIERGVAHPAGSPSRSISVADIAHIAYFRVNELPDGVPPGLESSERYSTSAPMIWANATHVCSCEVDIETGQVSVLRYIVAEDCGPMINPNVVEGQIAGGVVQGIGGVLLEHLAYDEEANPLATTFMDYLLPTASDVPTLEYVHIETPASGPGGYKGVGEGGAIGAPSAVVNAIADALAPLGVEITRLPLTPAAIIDLIGRAP